MSHGQPVPKKGAKNDPSNYRPIAITPLLTKTTEKVTNFKMMNYLEANHLLHEENYLCDKNRS